MNYDSTSAINKFQGSGMFVLLAPTRAEIEFERGYYNQDEHVYTVTMPYQVLTPDGFRWAIQVTVAREIM